MVNNHLPDPIYDITTKELDRWIAKKTLHGVFDECQRKYNPVNYGFAVFRTGSGVPLSSRYFLEDVKLDHPITYTFRKDMQCDEGVIRVDQEPLVNSDESYGVSEMREMMKMGEFAPPFITNQGSRRKLNAGHLEAYKELFAKAGAEKNTLSYQSISKGLRHLVPASADFIDLGSPQWLDPKVREIVRKQDGESNVYTHFGSCGTVTALHVVVYMLDSLHYLLAGKPKIWVVIPPGQADKLERIMKQLYKDTTQCESFLHHQNCVVDLKILEREGIDYQIFEQQVGDLVFVYADAYTMTFDVGTNITQVINTTSARWYDGVWKRYVADCQCLDIDVTPPIEDLVPILTLEVIEKSRPNLWRAWIEQEKTPDHLEQIVNDLQLQEEGEVVQEEHQQEVQQQGQPEQESVPQQQADPMWPQPSDCENKQGEQSNLDQSVSQEAYERIEEEMEEIFNEVGIAVIDEPGKQQVEEVNEPKKPQVNEISEKRKERQLQMIERKRKQQLAQKALQRRSNQHAQEVQGKNGERMIETIEYGEKVWRRIDGQGSSIKMPNAERTHECDTCGSAFRHKHHLTRHLATHETGPKKYKCDHCEMRFHFKDQKTRHMRVTHEDNERIGCPECDQLYKNIHVLRRHFRETHNTPKNKELTCPRCLGKFKIIGRLNQHLRKCDAFNR
ncbi:unnamed protein product [Sphagnum tenellum]